MESVNIYREKLQPFQIDKFNSAHQTQLYILLHNDRRFEINEAVFQLVRFLKQEETLEAVAEKYSAIRKKSYTVEDIEKWISVYLMPIWENDLPPKRTPFIINKSIVPAELIHPLTNQLKYLFQPILFSVLFVIGVLLQIYFLWQAPLENNTDFSDISGALLLWVGFLIFISTIFHELGHAAACRYYKAEHGALGIGLYLYFPVFYADVTDVWKLSRWQRTVVDLGGIYFQLIFLIPITLLYFYYPEQTYLKYCIYMIDISFLIDLNPFFKFDGYWIFSDLTGVPNLRKRTYELLPYFIKKMKGVTPLAKPFLFQMRPLEKWIMLVYTLTVNVFFAYFFFYKIPLIAANMLSVYPGLISDLIASINDGSFDFSLLRVILVQSMFMGITIFLLYSFSKSIIVNVGRLRKI